MSDLIDRAQAQTELQFATRRYIVAHEANGEGKVVWSDNLISVTDAIDALRKVPSAQLGTDCISRQAAIDALKKAYWDKDIQSAKNDPCIVDAMTDWAIRQVKALPSAQPEHIKGKWLPYKYAMPGKEYKFHVCSVCGVCDEYVVDVPRPNGTIARLESVRNFCPNCGAKMVR